MSTDFWTLDDAANADVPEPPKPTSSDLPDKAAVLVRTCDAEDKETVHPVVKPFERKDGSGTFYIFKCPVMVLGGDNKITERNVGRYLFMDMNVEKPTVEQLETWMGMAEEGSARYNRLKGQLDAHEKYPCGPELYNLILDALAPEAGTARDRWAKARGIMAPFGHDPKEYGGNSQVAVAAAFREALMAGRRTLIGQTYTPKKKDGAQYDPQQTLGSIGSDTPEERKRRKVRLIEKAAEEGF